MTLHDIAAWTGKNPQQTNQSAVANTTSQPRKFFILSKSNKIPNK